jgi:hypothetical protein
LRSSKLAAAAALAVLFVVGACGGGTPTNAPATTTAGGQPTAAGGQPTAPGGGPTTAPGGGTDSCSLLTLADIKSATGKDFPAGTLDAGGTCNFELVTDTFNSVTVSVLANTSFPDTRAAFPGGTDTTVSGHTAYWGPKDNLLEAIWVEVGADVLVVTIAPSPADAQAITKKLAEAAVARM